jgi:hypothetical protein
MVIAALTVVSETLTTVKAGSTMVTGSITADAYGAVGECVSGGRESVNRPQSVA